MLCQLLFVVFVADLAQTGYTVALVVVFFRFISNFFFVFRYADKIAFGCALRSMFVCV